MRCGLVLTGQKSRKENCDSRILFARQADERLFAASASETLRRVAKGGDLHGQTDPFADQFEPNSLADAPSASNEAASSRRAIAHACHVLLLLQSCSLT
jgi:hypothetical protein